MSCRAGLPRRKSAALSRSLQIVVDCAYDSQTVDKKRADSSKVRTPCDSQTSRSSHADRQSSDLYAALRPQVAQIARVLIGENPPTDLVHDICVDVTLSRPRFRGNCAFSTWLHAIANHHVRNWIRRERTYRNLIRAAEQACLRNRVLRPDEVVDMFVLIDQLRTGFAALTEAQRACLILVRCECLSPQEVATLLNTTPTAVRMNVHRARAHLRRWLDQDAK